MDRRDREDRRDTCGTPLASSSKHQGKPKSNPKNNAAVLDIGTHCWLGLARWHVDPPQIVTIESRPLAHGGQLRYAVSFGDDHPPAFADDRYLTPIA